jgi:hypothetical protein
VADLHTPDEAVLDQVDVLYGFVSQDFAIQVTNDLVNVHHDSPGLVGLEAKWLYMRVDQQPLAGPVIADTAVAMDPAALHAVGPIDVWVHGRQSRFDVAGVERRVGCLQKTLHCTLAEPDAQSGK